MGKRARERRRLRREYKLNMAKLTGSTPFGNATKGITGILGSVGSMFSKANPLANTLSNFGSGGSGGSGGSFDLSSILEGPGSNVLNSLKTVDLNPDPDPPKEKGFMEMLMNPFVIVGGVIALFFFTKK